MFKQNIGLLDSWLRFAAGFIIIFVGYFYGQPWALLGLIPVFTFIFSWCPLYTFLGIDTRDRC